MHCIVQYDHDSLKNEKEVNIFTWCSKGIGAKMNHITLIATVLYKLAS